MSMSANNQTLIQEYGGRFYVFGNVQAESWVHYDEKTRTFDDSRVNELPLESAISVHDTREEALNAALTYDEYGGTEYGVQFNALCKDGAPLTIIPPHSTQ